MRLKKEELYKVLVRPTVVITTISKNGIPNAAPFRWTKELAQGARAWHFVDHASSMTCSFDCGR